MRRGSRIINMRIDFRWGEYDMINPINAKSDV